MKDFPEKLPASPREMAYLALLDSLRNDVFIEDSIEMWHNTIKPSTVDYHLCQAIAYGSARMALSLDYLAKALTDDNKLKLKLRERVLLRTALYQHYYMDRIPLFAIANETVTLAKKYCHSYFVNFLNAILRKASDKPLELPQEYTVEALSIRFSFPPFIIERLLEEYGPDKAVEIMEASNTPSQTMVRMRLLPSDLILPWGQQMLSIEGSATDMRLVKDTSAIAMIGSSADYYIQNITPATLINKLAATAPYPKNILDLCASPGGKLLAAHDRFPLAALFANDISEVKVKKLKENIDKYHLDVNITCGPGELYKSSNSFDLIILDVPCSNSGVLNKRPEARWRISTESQDILIAKQLLLIDNAIKLLSDKGHIWYLTCSILKDENEKLITNACERYGLKVFFLETILPNKSGWDGGFACCLAK